MKNTDSVSVRDQAIDLRKKGYSYNYIAQKLSVSKGTLSYWLAKIPYTPNAETVSVIGRARAASGRAKSLQKLESISRAHVEAKADIGTLNQRDLFMVGLGLYIGEGSKTHDLVRIVNSDPRVIRFAVRWFHEAVGIPKKNFSVRIHLYPDTDECHAKIFWSKEIGLPLGQFQKSQVDYRQGKKISRKGKLPHGTAHLTVNSCGEKRFGVFLARKVEAWTEEVFKERVYTKAVYPQRSKKIQT